MLRNMKFISRAETLEINSRAETLEMHVFHISGAQPCNILYIIYI